MTTFRGSGEELFAQLIAAGMAEALELDPPLDQDQADDVAVSLEPHRQAAQAA